MEHRLQSGFITIAEEIVNRNLNVEDWALIESPDEFQTDEYSGGFEATEMSFCFSYYGSDNKEYWFQISLEEIGSFVNGDLKIVGVSDAS